MFKSIVKTSKHMVAKGCMDCAVSINYDSNVFKIIIAKKENTASLLEPISDEKLTLLKLLKKVDVPSLLKPISDEEINFVEILHTPDYSWGSGLMPVLQYLEDVSDIPLDDYLSSDTVRVIGLILPIFMFNYVGD